MDIRDSLFLRRIDGRRVQIESVELRVRESLRHYQAGRTMPHPTSAMQLRHSASLGRHLARVSIFVSDWPHSPLEKATVVSAQRKARSGAEALSDKRFIMINSPDGVKPARHSGRTLRHGTLPR
jgi:hypothetical protein